MEIPWVFPSFTSDVYLVFTVRVISASAYT
jgi:hypothetical protein